MDNLIQKFYSNGKEEQSKYSQFGAFSNSLLKNSSPNLNFKTTGFIRPNISTINPSSHNIETASTQNPKTPNKTPPLTQEAFLRPKKLIFNGTNDLFNSGIIKNNLVNNKDINPNNINNNAQNNIPSLNTIKQNMNLESKKNATKMQMMEEKMKNLELKSQRLEVINEFFFDMFENNMVKEELKRQNIKKNEEKDEDKENNEEELNILEKKKKKIKNKRKKKNLNIDIMDLEAKKTEEMEFKKKTKTFANNYLKSVKNDIGLFLVEDQLKKNENMQDLIENILDLRGDLVNKIERLQMNQDMEMKKMAYILQNSGDPVVENLANRIFGNDLLSNNANPNNPNNSNNNTNAVERNSLGGRNSLGPRGSIFNKRNSLFSNLMKSRRQSINSNARQSFVSNGNGEEKVPRRKSLFGKENNDNPRRQSLLDKENENKSKRQSLLQSIIPEEKNEN